MGNCRVCSISPSGPRQRTQSRSMRNWPRRRGSMRTAARAVWAERLPRIGVRSRRGIAGEIQRQLV